MRASTPTAPVTITAGVPPSSPAAVSAQVRAPRPATASTVPGTSRWWLACGSRDSGHVPQRHDHDHHGERDVDEEHRAPGPLDQEAAEERADRPGDAAQARPGADGRGAVAAVERRRDQRQAARGQQRAADALQRAPGDEELHRRREPAERRGHREPHDADDEDPAAAEAVAERAAEQDQPGEGERVAVDRPLQRREARVELGADALERDVDHRRVEQGQPRPEHGRQQDPAAPGAAHPDGVGAAGGVGHGLSMVVAPVRDEVGRPDTVHPS